MVISKGNEYTCFREDPLVKKFINLLTKSGKKSKSEKIINRVFFFLQNKYPGEVLNIFYLSVFNTQLLVNIRKRPRGKKYRRSAGLKEAVLPYFIDLDRSQTLALRSIFLYANKKHPSLNIYKRLSQELVKVASQKGDSILKRHDIHSLATINRRQYRYRWVRNIVQISDNLNSN